MESSLSSGVTFETDIHRSGPEAQHAREHQREQQYQH